MVSGIMDIFTKVEHIANEGYVSNDLAALGCSATTIVREAPADGFGGTIPAAHKRPIEWDHIVGL